MTQVAYTGEHPTGSEWDDLFSSQVEPANETQSPVPPKILSEQQVAWKTFTSFVQELSEWMVVPEGLSIYYATLKAYRALRETYVARRKRRRNVIGLARWTRQTNDFRDTFWGRDHGRWVGRDTYPEWTFGQPPVKKRLLTKRVWKQKREMDGVPPHISSWLRAWQGMWNEWWPLSAAGKRSKRKRNAKQARRPEVKAAKALANKTEAARASRKKQKKNAAKAKQIAKAAAQQELLTQWSYGAEDLSVEEVLADV
ncbi:MAG: hypothetical protein WDO74_17855 [Pseudomonadota bacterium]